MLSIFNLFKSKVDPIFEILGVDMHNHLLPGVDDGSKSIEMTMSCIRTMWEVGYKKIYVTPHFQFPRFPNDEEDIKQRYLEMCKVIRGEGIEMELIGVGGEYRIDDSFEQRANKNRFLTIGKEEYVLLELSLHHPRMGFEQTIYDLQMQDREVILAHPERYVYLDNNSKQLEKLKDQGVLFQCNVLSLSGFYGREAKRKALDMIDRGWIDFLGTDMHNEVYAKALRDATKSRTLWKVLEKYEFMNSRMEGVDIEVKKI